MATRNIVPRADGEGGIGTSLKKWLYGFFHNLTVTGTITGNVTGTASGNLPLTGGTMTGSITLNGNQAIKNAVTDDYIEFKGGTEEETGAHLSLYGKDHATKAGGFALEANDGVNSGRMEGTPNGGLTWDSKEVERVTASGSNYIRYENGLQICFGNISISGNGDKTITYGASFATNNPPCILVSLRYAAQNEQASIFDNNSTGFKATLTNAGTNNHTLYYCAIGKWK